MGVHAASRLGSGSVETKAFSLRGAKLWLNADVASGGDLAVEIVRRFQLNGSNVVLATSCAISGRDGANVLVRWQVPPPEADTHASAAVSPVSPVSTVSTVSTVSPLADECVESLRGLVDAGEPVRT